MPVFTKEIKLGPTNELDMVDITDSVVEIVEQSEIKNGFASVFISGSTASIITMEFEDGLKKDLANMLEKIAPKNGEYAHQEAWHDNNGHSHMRASLLGSGITVPFAEGKVLLGTWQQIVFVELDVKERNREVVVQVVGD